MKLRQKVSLGCFLCLSLVMVCIAFVRAVGFRIGDAEDITWDLYWIYMEACVACIMSSVAVMPAIFGNPGSRSPKPIEGECHSMSQRKERNMRKGSSRRFWWELEEGENDGVAEIPAVTLSGLRTSIDRSGQPATDTMQSSIELEQD